MSSTGVEASEEPAPNSDPTKELLERAKALEKQLAKAIEEQLANAETPAANAVPENLGKLDVEESEESPESALATVRLRQERMQLKHEKQRLALRKRVADFATATVTAQLLVTNALFASYLFANIGSADSAVLIAWLSSTVVEVIGIVYVIAKSLFPNHDGNSDEK